LRLRFLRRSRRERLPASGKRENDGPNHCFGFAHESL
jgi:hypothetical protein